MNQNHEFYSLILPDHQQLQCLYVVLRRLQAVIMLRTKQNQTLMELLRIAVRGQKFEMLPGIDRLVHVRPLKTLPEYVNLETCL